MVVPCLEGVGEKSEFNNKDFLSRARFSAKFEGKKEAGSLIRV